MTEIPDSHPRAVSLRLREKIVAGVRNGYTSHAGLIAHGRGEAFYYLLGETTHEFAREAIEAASAMLLTAAHPVFSVNGNVAALAAGAVAEYPNLVSNLWLEVNLFHYTEDRVQRIATLLSESGANRVLGAGQAEWIQLPGVRSARAKMNVEGVAKADVVLVPLEDGDRCQALVASGRKVITVDLNPLSRTAQAATVTIVDELTHVLPALRLQILADRGIGRSELIRRLDGYDNERVLTDAVQAIRKGVDSSPGMNQSGGGER